MENRKVPFCWLCGNKLRGNRLEILWVDHHLRTFHKVCAKEVKREYDFIKREGQYFSVFWTTDDMRY